MSANENTIVLITGTDKGIGRGLVREYLQRPNHTILAGMRSEKKADDEISDHPRATDTLLYVLEIDYDHPETIPKALEYAKNKYALDHIDVVISNAGIERRPQHGTKDTPLNEMVKHYEVNALGPLALWRGTLPWLQKSYELNHNPRFVAMSSNQGSIGLKMPFPLEYAASKAALNMIVMQMHVEVPEICAFVIHPGWVQTRMGNESASMVGMDEAPTTIEESVKGVINVIDGAFANSMSGRYMTWKGVELPW
ncbi:hypothetical protein KEM55_003021 [Ascosphaera atra]|nr:hypothetical protein KEM55_003021 [Ascosphaera atra]